MRRSINRLSRKINTPEMPNDPAVVGRPRCLANEHDRDAQFLGYIHLADERQMVKDMIEQPFLYT